MVQSHVDEASAPFDGAALGSWAPTFWRSIALSFSFRRFAAKYFSQLDVEFEALCPPEYKALVWTEIQALRAHDAKRPSWKLNHRYEYLLLDGLPEPVLRQRMTIFRARLLALVGTDTAAFEAAHPEPTPETALAVLREQARGLLAEIQRMRFVRSEFDRLRNRLIAASMVPGFAFAGLALWFAPLFWSMPLARVAAILGLFGGYLSVLLRVGSLKWALSYAVNYQQVDRLFWNLFLNFYLSLLEGCLGAIVVYIAFSAGLLQGDLFPHIPDSGHELVWARDLDHGTFARLMLWCIAAGFSERAVPDLLSGLAKDLRRTQDAPAKGESG